MAQITETAEIVCAIRYDDRPVSRRFLSHYQVRASLPVARAHSQHDRHYPFEFHLSINKSIINK